MFQKLSRWDCGGEIESPNGKYTLLYCHGSEIAMGGPTVGQLYLLNHLNGNKQIIAESTTASIIWSNDSAFFAYVKWGETSRQSETICIIRIADMKQKVAEVNNRGIEFQAFGHGFLKLYDYPAYNIVGRVINVNTLFDE